MMKYLMLNCSEATMLMAKREEGKISLKDRVQLYLHTSMCAFCRKFDKQSLLIGKECRHVHTDEKLSVNAKEKFEQLIREELK